jgi:hypothetical protein
MAEFTKGKTFESDEKLTPAKLNALIDNGTVTNIGLSDLGPSLQSYFHGVGDPGVTAPRIWFDGSPGFRSLKYGFHSPSSASVCGWLTALPYREAYYWASTRVSYGTPLFAGRRIDVESNVAMHKYDGLNMMKVYHALGSTNASESQMPLVVATESAAGAGPIRCAWAGLVPALTYDSHVSLADPLFIDHHNAARFTALTQIPSTILDNLVANWEMNSGSGVTQVDLSGNNHYLYKRNAACAEGTGKLDNTLLFDEDTNKCWHADDHADFDIGSGDYSWSMWVAINTKTPTGNNMELVDRAWGSGGLQRTYRFFYNKPNDTFGLTAWDASNNFSYVYAGPNPSVSTWYCLQGYHASGVIGLRINGGAWTTASIANPLFDFASRLTVGLDDANLNPLDGAVDEIALWKGKKLSDAEFDSIYNSGNGIKLASIAATPQLKRASIYGVVLANADNTTPASNPRNFLLWGTGPALQDIKQ